VLQQGVVSHVCVVPYIVVFLRLVVLVYILCTKGLEMCVRVSTMRSYVGLSPPLKISSCSPMSDPVCHMLYVFYTQSGVSLRVANSLSMLFKFSSVQWC
jgi:hypothetical protein